ncbi:MAG: AAA family ATPase [Rhodocyclaceae bacterium]|nr:AAA family ATPase [Rhodocyclaceae bacterium]
MARLELKFLGEFGVFRDGRAQPLPPSRKTRALLAYLCLADRRLRREQLCELLWEVPDDPRGSLRWSLSKLRRLLDDEGRERILADRSHVALDAGDLSIDSRALQLLAAGELARAPTEALEQAAAHHAGAFLEGLEFSDFHDFHCWCVAEREQVARAQAAVLHELVRRLAGQPQRALPHARALVGLTPYDEAARATLIRLLVAAQHIDEAEQQFQLGMRMLAEAGIAASGALLQARRGTAQAGAATRADAAAAVRPAAPPAALPADHTLVGRERERQVLAEALVASGAGRARVVLVRGEAGMGKSRLLDDLADAVRADDRHLLAASAFETGAMRPFALWIDALRSRRAEAAQRIFGDIQADNRDRLFAELSELVATESERGAAVLMFDDVHWCDESSAAALHYVMRMNRGRPVLAVLATREAELRDNAPLQQALRGLRRDALLHELKLEPLTEPAIAELVRSRAPGADARRLCRECGGNPLLAIELARAECEGGAEGGGSLDDLVRERLARFDVEGADVLRWAAVLGPRIELPTLTRFAGVDAATVTRALELAERQATLRTADDGTLRFAHDLIARAIYDDISPLRRQLMHRKVAEWMEHDLGFELSRAADLAHHAGHSGDPGLAARALVSAGRLCLRFFANDEAHSLADKGLQLAAQLPAAEQVRVAIDLHMVMLDAAPVEDWEAAAQRYVALAEQALDHGAAAHARQAYQMASYLRWQHGHWTGAREQSLQSERVVRGGSEDEHIVGMAETAKCLAMLERDLAQADAMLMEAQALASRRQLVHRAIPAGLGMLRFYENRLDEAEELFQQTRTLCKAAGDRINEYQANEYLVMIDIQRARWSAARARCDELVVLGEKLREGSEAPFAHALVGLCEYALHDRCATLDAALAALRAADAKHRTAFVQTRAALLDCERGRHAASQARAAEALACAEVLERATEMLVAHAVLSQCALAAGDDTVLQAHLDAVARLESEGVAAWALEIARRARECGRERRA